LPKVKPIEATNLDGLEENEEKLLKAMELHEERKKVLQDMIEKIEEQNRRNDIGD